MTTSVRERDPVDPRPMVTLDDPPCVQGSRCSSCGYVVADDLERCPLCGAGMGKAVFGPSGTVFSATVVRIGLPGREPPYGLAYVDLDDGPRILAHTPVLAGEPAALTPGDRVTVLGSTDLGDPLVGRVAP